MNITADVTSTYPTMETICNISRETTYKELCKIEGMNNHDIRQIGVDLSGAKANAVELVGKIYGLPDLSKLKTLFLEDRQQLENQQVT